MEFQQGLIWTVTPQPALCHSFETYLLQTG